MLQLTTRRSAFSPEESLSMLSTARGPDNQAQRAAYRRFLSHSIQTLPPKQREALMLHELDGHTIRECARILQVNPSTVCRRVNAAKKELRRLAQLCQNAGLFPN